MLVLFVLILEIARDTNRNVEDENENNQTHVALRHTILAFHDSRHRKRKVGVTSNGSSNSCRNNSK